jgi:hypothetical protein
MSYNLAMSIDTSNCPGRRTLKFSSLSEAIAEADRLAEAERTGRLKQCGNWTLGQALGHLAAWAEFSYTGAPLKPPFFIRWILRMQKNNFLYSPMRAGVKIPRVAGGTLATEVVSTEDGLTRMRAAFERLERETPTAPNVIFGPLTHDEWRAINLRHAELHLSFFDVA